MGQENHLNMKQDLFTILPSDIVIDILSRLPVRSIISCKCVHKSWLHLVESREFVKSHLSKSTPGLTECLTHPPNGSSMYKFFKFEDGSVEHHLLHYKLVAKFDLTDAISIVGSADGLLLLGGSNSNPYALGICNPTTREYINLNFSHDYCNQPITYGFGSSKVTGKYKVVRIVYNFPKENECYIYTLGTGSWRRLASPRFHLYKWASRGTFVNGNLHWLACDVITKGSPVDKISCFDLETEQFSDMSAPFPQDVGGFLTLSLFVLGDRLGLCDNSSRDEIVIWLMKEYGDEKSWSKEFVLNNSIIKRYRPNIQAFPIKVFKDGDILLHWNQSFIYYSSKAKTTRRISEFEEFKSYYFCSTLYTPSFVSLKNFGLDVISF